MSHIPTSELAALTGYSKRQIQRMAENGEIPKAQRNPGGHWVIPDSKQVRRWIACHRKAAMPEKIDHGHRGSLNAAETHQLAKEIHIKANSLRRALRRATWFPGHPIWNWVWQDLEPLRVTLESLCMPIDQALDFIQKEKEKRPVRGRSSH
jgi:hypothetical protein